VLGLQSKTCRVRLYRASLPPRFANLAPCPAMCRLRLRDMNHSVLVVILPDSSASLRDIGRPGVHKGMDRAGDVGS
jgi:hypothetical protein